MSDLYRPGYLAPLIPGKTSSPRIKTSLLIGGGFIILCSFVCLLIVAVGLLFGRDRISAAFKQLSGPAFTPTPTPVPSLKVGDTFTAGDYEAKLIQVVEWDKVTILTSNGFDTLPPKESGNSWLIVALEINSKSAAVSLNLGNLTSVLALGNTDAVLVDATGQKYELSGVGTSVPDKGWILTLIDQTPSTMVALFQGTPSGKVFIQPGGYNKLAIVQNPLQNGQIVLSQESLLADPAGPKWYVGLKKQGAETNVAQFSLLFEVPKDKPELSLQLLGSSLPVKLPKTIIGTPSQQNSSGGLTITSMTVTHSEMCKAWQDLIPCK